MARVIDELLGRKGVGNIWLDLLDGEEEIRRVVERVVREGVNAAKGKDFAV